MSHRIPVIVVLSATLLSALAGSAEADTRVVLLEDWSTAFGGEEIPMRVRVISDRVPQGSIQWSHAADQRTLARGAVELRATGEVSAVAEFVLNPAELREGVIFETTVTAEFLPRGSSKPTASLKQTLWLFPRNPLEGKSEWAKQLDIELLDSDGRTMDVFDDWQLPYRRIRSATDDAQTGVLIVGEGASLVRSRSLATGLLQAAANGRRVVLLAPAEGALTMPGTEGDGLPAGSIGELRLARQKIITELDKRLDSKAWPGTDNAVPFRGLQLESRRGRIEATVGDEPHAWPWLEVRFPETRGVLVICGFTVIEHWEHGPTPRYLLTRLLESLERK